MKKELKRIIIVLIGICILFVSLIVYLSYFQIFKAEEITKNSYNKRLWINEEKIQRGSIIDRNGKILAYSEKDGETYKRFYNYENLYSHIIGYSYREYGKVGLELEYNNALLNITDSNSLNELKNIVAPSTEGNTLKLSIDHHIQEYSRELLKGKKGSIVAMNPKTGEIYSMVSLPDFNTSTLKEDWTNIMEDPDSPFLNRATSGLYSPGSVFKLIPAIAALETPDLNKEYECKGKTVIDGYTIRDYGEKAHGNLGLEDALVKSCNTYFAEASIKIGKDRLGEVADRFMINKKIPFDLPTKKSSFPYKGNLGETDIASAGLGQGKVLVTPLNMAMIASGIANKGEIVKPILVKETISPGGATIDYNETNIISEGTNVFNANELKDMMVEVVNRGTGTNAAINNVKVAGKTGTAENPSEKSHAWFVGFAPADEPEVAIAVILEEDGTTGGKTAAPIARNIIMEILNTIK